MSLVWVPDPVRDQLVEVAAAMRVQHGAAVEFYEVIEHLLAEHPRSVSCGETHPGMDIYCMPDGTHPRKCCGGAGQQENTA
jgi:hypothetical protein